MFSDEKLVCPKCGRQSPMRSFELSKEYHALLECAARFGRSWPWVREYLRSFQSDEDRPLKASRLLLLAEELWGMIDRKEITYQRRTYAIRPDAIFAAIREVALRNKIGFRNHNYLKKVAIDINGKMIDEEEKEAQKRAQLARERLERDPNGAEKIREIIKQLSL